MEHANSESLITEELLRKVELQKAQMELSVRFQKNMVLFQKISPNIFNAFKDYQPEELRLSFHAEGYVELVNFKLNNKPVYPVDPKDFAQQQVATFKKKPTLSNITLSKSTPYNDRHFHLDLVNEVLDIFTDDREPKRANTDNPIGLLIMTGCGLGYQIEELISRCDIYGLCLFDPHKDSFYASLHTIDWTPIIEHFNQSGRMIKLCIGMTVEKTLTHIKLLTDSVGLHNIICTYIYRHFNSVQEQAFVDAYKKQFHLNAFGLGYYDDEQISLAHSVANVNAKIPLLKAHGRNKHSTPVFIIGNGPSLDLLKDFLMENKDNAILVSCGTALGSLCNMGIKPDFHVEMERTRTMLPWLKKGTNAEFRKGIRILGLNTLYPEVFELFDQGYMALKANDLGCHLTTSELPEHNLEVLNHCNPTVTNCALSFSKSLGFSNFYLVGVDLGMVDEESHHAKSSPHYHLDEKKIKAYSYLENQYQVEGNFVETVKTNPTLDSSRVSMEGFIASNRDITVYNLNNGAKINGAVSMHAEDVSRITSSPEDKKCCIESIDQSFYDISEVHFDKDNIHKKYLQPLYTIKKQLHLSDKVSSTKDIYLELGRVYSIIRGLESINPTASILLRGSVNTFLGFVSKFCLFGKEEDLLKNYHLIREKYHTLLKLAYKNIKEDVFRNDDTLVPWQEG